MLLFTANFPHSIYQPSLKSFSLTNRLALSLPKRVRAVSRKSAALSNFAKLTLAVALMM